MPKFEFSLHSNKQTNTRTHTHTHTHTQKLYKEGWWSGGSPPDQTDRLRLGMASNVHSTRVGNTMAVPNPLSLRLN